MRFILTGLAAWALSLSAHAEHAYAQFGAPKYAKDFTHFDYANPNAPKGGVLKLSNTGNNSSFDKFNPFSLRGRAAPGLMELMFETLTIYSLDERNTQYGLLAQDIRVAEDLQSVTFTLNPKARFSNGDPVTALDVKYAFETLTSPLASPSFSAYFADIAKVTVDAPLTVTFTFKRASRELPFVAGSLPVFSPKWAGNKGFDELRLEAPIASGPYQILKANEGRDIRYVRRSDYWGDDLAVRRGSLNFKEVAYKLFKDRDTQVSALRAGQYDAFSEIQMRYWCCQYIGKRFDSGELKKTLFPHHNPPAMVGHGFNLRRELFQDPKVRQALLYALDFEWVNQKIFDNSFKRVYSYFSTTEWAAHGEPNAEELKILEPLRAQLDPAVFGPLPELPNTNPPNSLRQNLTKALELFGQAGWHNTDGVLRNAKGEPFVFTVNTGRGDNLLLDPYYRNLRKLGIEVRPKPADAATLYSQVKDFNFDFTPFGLRETRTPAAEIWRAFNSHDANIQGSGNALGVNDPVIDLLTEKLLNAASLDEQTHSARALDRVLLHGFYVQPWRYLTDHHLIHHERLRHPEVLPRYYGAMEWMMTYWWDSHAATHP